MTTPASPVTFTNKGHSVYEVKGHPGLLVTKSEGRSWSGRRGSYAWTKWTAMDHNQEPSVALAVADNMETLRKRLGVVFAHGGTKTFDQISNDARVAREMAAGVVFPTAEEVEAKRKADDAVNGAFFASLCAVLSEKP